MGRPNERPYRTFLSRIGAAYPHIPFFPDEDSACNVCIRPTLSITSGVRALKGNPMSMISTDITTRISIVDNMPIVDENDPLQTQSPNGNH
jgi:hypothetical protein